VAAQRKKILLLSSHRASARDDRDFILAKVPNSASLDSTPRKASLNKRKRVFARHSAAAQRKNLFSMWIFECFFLATIEPG
jgi:hypothetical protein